MTLGLNKGLLPAGLVAVALHLPLFMLERPYSGVARTAVQHPPMTRICGSAKAVGNRADQKVRTLSSPVMFSLPSGMGFSRALLQEDVRTALTFKQDVEAEQFLNLEPVAYHAGAQIIPGDLMVTARAMEPGLPQAAAAPPKKKAAPRLYMAPELKTRLEGGVVLPPVLNQATVEPWEVLADVSVSPEGRVRHVFLEKPLEQAALNQQVLQLLHGLRFRPGTAVEGRIELYAPQALTHGGAE